MPRVVFTLASIALTVFALADCIQANDDRMRGLPRWAWILLIVFVPWVGPITWLVVSRLLRDPEAVKREARFSRPLAPDEDPEFLRKLDEDIRRERRLREQKAREALDGDITNDADPVPGPESDGNAPDGPASDGPASPRI